jgi:hypothetical protein
VAPSFISALFGGTAEAGVEVESAAARALVEIKWRRFIEFALPDPRSRLSSDILSLRAIYVKKKRFENAQNY